MTQQLPQYDFYATPTGAPSPAPAASATPSAPAYGTAVNQFGTPLGVPGASLPAAATAAAPVRSSGGVRVPGWLWRWALGLAVAAVLGLFGVGRLGFLDVFHQPLEAPATLGGLSVEPAGSALRASLAPLTDAVDRSAQDDRVVVEVYSDGVSRAAVLIAGRDAGEIEDGVAGMRDAGGEIVQVGTASCGVHAANGVAMCVGESDGVAAVVMHTGTDPAAPAALLTEALAALD